MPRATDSYGNLTPIEDCWILIPYREKDDADGNGITWYDPNSPKPKPKGEVFEKIILNNLPDLGDGKQAVYNNIPVMGRSAPFYTYSHSGDRTINLQLHFFITKKGDADTNLKQLRLIQSAVYPRQGNEPVPYIPPTVRQIKMGQLLGTSPLCAILQSYSVRFPTDVAWDKVTMCPYRFDVDTSWYIVYSSENLPHANRIVYSGR